MMSTGNRKLLPQGLHQSGDLAGAAGKVNALDVFAAGGGAEEIKGLLNFQHDDLGHLLQDAAAWRLR